MKRLLLLTCGGTIAASPSATGLRPTAGGEEMLNLLPELRARCQITVQEAFNLDSSNVQPEQWQLLARAIDTALPSYDGIVISHGTDTMAYTASALSFMLQGLPKPVVLTGAQLPIQAAHSDGLTNLRDAFTVALAGRAGVLLVFAGKIMLGCRASKLRTTSAEAFYSINAPDLGRVQNGTVIWTEAPMPPPTAYRLQDKLESAVLLLKLAPGLRTDIITAAQELGYRGLVVEGYGSGNVPDTGRDLGGALIGALQAGLAVAVTSQCLWESADLSIYAPGARLLRAGVISAADMTTEALYTKLCWVLGQTATPAEIHRLMCSNLAGELNG